MDFRREQLDNGLEIIGEVNPAAYSAALAFFVRTGARDETAELAGVSHFLEHMAFKGSAKRSALDINREIDDIGAHANAFTSEEQTVYYATFVPDYQDRALDLLADLMRPALRDDDFEVEKKVILEEIHKYADQPPFGAYEKCLASFFHPHPLGNNVLGSVESVSALTPQAMRGYFESRYGTDNLTVVAAGNVDFDSLVRQAASLSGAWRPSGARRSTASAHGKPKIDLIHRPQATQEYVLQIAAGPDAMHELRFAHRLMTIVFGDECGSRLFWALVDPGRVEFASVGGHEYEGAGITMTYLGCSPEDVTENLEVLGELQQELMAEGITEEELEIAKSKVTSQIVRRAERPGNRLFSVGNNWLQRRIYRSVRDSLDSYLEVTLDDVTRALQAFPLTSHAMTLSGPLTGEEAQTLGLLPGP